MLEKEEQVGFLLLPHILKSVDEITGPTPVADSLLAPDTSSLEAET